MKLISALIASLLFVSVSAQTNSAASPVQPQALTRADKMPEFPGGFDSLNSFIARNLQYPKVEKVKGIEGITAVKFIVNTDGTITDITVPRKLTPACDEEAVRITKLFPRFIPGRHGGKPVKVWYPVAFNFVLPK
ncbi:MAG: energy transducer TonB [Bacteroidota bacterium]